MALKSMTGFGDGSASAGNWRVDVEISSVNRKQFDCSFSFPRDLSTLEAQALATVRARIHRGYIKGIARVHGTDAGYDSEQIRAQVDSLRELARELGLHDDISARSLIPLLRDPGVAQARAPKAAEIAPLLENALNQALDSLLAMRAAEGAGLQLDIGRRLEKLKALYRDVRKRAPAAALQQRKALLERLEDLDPPFPADDPSLLREIALLADRADISEETTRLESHLAQADQLLESNEPCGRTFDFLCQELLREINTVGSKAGDLELTKTVINFKAELEAVREQIQNVE